MRPFSRNWLPARVILLTVAVSVAAVPYGKGSNENAERRPNHLAGEKSPYLLQHIYNLVDWYPWGEEAFLKAKVEDKPIFLSVGFSTCYWCHLMAEECFNDTQVASFMNEHFVSIKVDREERPDIDQIYMGFIQASTGKFGWPLSVFLTPDRQPFYGGGFFKRDAFLAQLRKIADEWRRNREAVLKAGSDVTNLLKGLEPEQREEGVLIGLELLEDTYQWYLKAFDPKNGGFGPAPRFPRPDDLNFLLRYHQVTGKNGPLRMVQKTLSGMANGGIRDHLGGGFHRYSTDVQWLFPRFEKLLFLQAGLAVNYLEAFQLSGEPPFEEVARETLNFVLKELRDSRGGFLSALGSASPCSRGDKERCEGVFYTWTADEITRILGKNAEIFRSCYGVKPDGNVPDSDYRELEGTNILHLARTVEQVAQELGLKVGAAKQILDDSRRRLLEIRSLRPKPEVDDKVLTGWNGLMISALCKGYQVLQDPRYLDAAVKAAEFVAGHLYDQPDNLLKRRFREDDAAIDGYLDDYALFVQGLIDLYETSLQGRWLDLALDLTEKQIALFYDEEQGGFFNSSGEDSSLLMRTKELYDGVEPSPNAISVSNLLRLSQMTNNSAWKSLAEKTVDSFDHRLARSPHAMPQLKVAAGFLIEKPVQIVIAGSVGDQNTQAIVREVHRRFIPYHVLIIADGSSTFKKLSDGLEILRSMRPLEGKATAYICEDYTCKYPTSDPDKVGALLDEILGAGD